MQQLKSTIFNPRKEVCIYVHALKSCTVVRKPGWHEIGSGHIQWTSNKVSQRKLTGDITQL